MDGLRERVFNQMPIRLLTVGPEIKLLERSEVFQHIVLKMRLIDETAFKRMVTEKISKVGSEQREEAEQEVIEDLMRKYAGYAVMSHTWLQNEPEVTFSTWPSIKDHRGAGYEKLEEFCKVVAKDPGVSFAWMDTVCINKDSSSELDESIRSMYRWYRDASICITYLADTSSLNDMARDRWFTRGWTLQELVAPRKIQFYNKTWTRLGFGDNDKEHRQVLWVIEAASGITHLELSEFTPGVGDRHAGGLSRRMVWAANRTTTRGEDTAYSLMGIFGVSISIAYGEGAERAFFRLIEAILTAFKDVFDVLNWAGRPISSNIHSSRLIPSSPRCFLGHVNINNWPSLKDWKPEVPFLESIGLTHHRFRVRLLVIAVWCDQIPTPLMRGFDSSLPEFTGETVVPQDSENRDKLYPTYRLGGKSVNSLLGAWNFVEEQDDVLFPEVCLGVPLELQTTRLEWLREQGTVNKWMGKLDSSDLHVNLNHNIKNLVTFKVKHVMSRAPILHYKWSKKHLPLAGMKVLTAYL
ncbi:heterokaryon incompatibility protein-domain-containing protein [Flammula alnicola]|nr:heterokaryon incompatibility protein-domain-containing protein [Flammula alnicola]